MIIKFWFWFSSESEKFNHYQIHLDLICKLEMSLSYKSFLSFRAYWQPFQMASENNTPLSNNAQDFSTRLVLLLQQNNRTTIISRWSWSKTTNSNCKKRWYSEQNLLKRCVIESSCDSLDLSTIPKYRVPTWDT